jgi:hypothetical protein
MVAAAEGGRRSQQHGSAISAADVYRLACAELQVVPHEGFLAALHGEREEEEDEELEDEEEGTRTVTLRALVRGCSALFLTVWF